MYVFSTFTLIKTCIMTSWSLPGFSGSHWRTPTCTILSCPYYIYNI